MKVESLFSRGTWRYGDAGGMATPARLECWKAGDLNYSFLSVGLSKVARAK
jgi:hypothetical protein